MRRKYANKLYDYIKSNKIEHNIITIKRKGKKRKEHYVIDYGKLNQKHKEYIFKFLDKVNKVK